MIGSNSRRDGISQKDIDHGLAMTHVGVAPDTTAELMLLQTEHELDPSSIAIFS